MILFVAEVYISATALLRSGTVLADDNIEFPVRLFSRGYGSYKQCVAARALFVVFLHLVVPLEALQCHAVRVALESLSTKRGREAPKNFASLVSLVSLGCMFVWVWTVSDLTFVFSRAHLCLVRHVDSRLALRQEKVPFELFERVLRSSPVCAWGECLGRRNLNDKL